MQNILYLQVLMPNSFMSGFYQLAADLKYLHRSSMCNDVIIATAKAPCWQQQIISCNVLIYLVIV